MENKKELLNQTGNKSNNKLLVYCYEEITWLKKELPITLIINDITYTINYPITHTLEPIFELDILPGDTGKIYTTINSTGSYTNNGFDCGLYIELYEISGILIDGEEKDGWTIPNTTNSAIGQLQIINNSASFYIALVIDNWACQ